MNSKIEFSILFTLLFGLLQLAVQGQSILPKRFIQRVTEADYPAEAHEVITSDGYKLTVHRIPSSPFLVDNPAVRKPVVFLMHGLLSSSDCWILAKENALAYLLADAGYDVWLGNARGNVYSSGHISKSTLQPSFWDFSFHEIGVIDLPTMIDFVLDFTSQSSLHYVGHSQGTTAFMVMLSELPSYNDKIKVPQMLAPVAFLKHAKSPLLRLLVPILGQPTAINALIGNAKLTPGLVLTNIIGREFCEVEVFNSLICTNYFFFFTGWDSQHFDQDLSPDIAETSGGGSVRQILHYAQVAKSDEFKEYDYGRILNYAKYQQYNAPKYNLNNIHPETPLELYYSDNDFYANVTDVMHLKRHLGSNGNLYHVEPPTFNHLDFVFAVDVKPLINDRVLSLINSYEDNH